LSERHLLHVASLEQLSKRPFQGTKHQMSQLQAGCLRLAPTFCGGSQKHRDKGKTLRLYPIFTCLARRKVHFFFHCYKIAQLTLDRGQALQATSIAFTNA
jgi:hypothetical protein